MGKSGEGRGLFRRRSTPPEQDPTIDITSVLSAYGRTATLAPAAAPVEVVDDDTVRYAGGPEAEVAAEPTAHEELVVDLTEDAQPTTETAGSAETAEVAAEAALTTEVLDDVDLAGTADAAGTAAEAEHAVDSTDIDGATGWSDPIETVEAVEAVETADSPLTAVEDVEAIQAEEAVEVASWQPEVEHAVDSADIDGATGWSDPIEAVETVDAEAEHADPVDGTDTDGTADWSDAIAGVAAVAVVETVGSHHDEVAAPDALAEGVVDDAVEDAPSEDPRPEHAEPVFAAVSQEIPPSAGWWEDSGSGWGPADHEQIDAVVHDSLPAADADTVPEPLSPDEAYGHHEDVVAHVEHDDHEAVAWAAAGAALAGDEAAEPVAASEEPVAEAAAPVAWWQALQTDDLGGLPVAGPEQHDEQHDHHHEVEAVALEDRLAPIDAPVPDQRPWWASLQDAAHDVPVESDVVDLRDESLSEEPEAVAARLARLRDAGLLSHEEYAAETASLLADRG